jgi:flagellar biosynthesis/type III secretory pathway protein FliH
VKLLDYQTKRQSLEATDNPFAIVMLAQLAVLETRGKPQARLQAKIEVVRKLYEKNFAEQDIKRLYAIVDWLVTLPKALIMQYNDAVKQIEGENNMNYITTAERIGREEGFKEAWEKSKPYITTAERIGREEGFKEAWEKSKSYIATAERIGREAGRQEGLQEGLQEGEAALLIHLLKRRFQHLPDHYLELIRQAGDDALLLWSDRLFDAVSLEEVFN